MKKSFILCVCLFALGVVAFSQNPAPTQANSPPLAASIAPTPTGSVSSSGDLADKIQQRIEKKFKHHHGVTIDAGDVEGHESGDIPESVFAIVGITMLTVFGAPVLIVGVIMLINYLKARSLHRTVQIMVEKGQPVPTALLAPPAVPRPRSDLRRGVVLVMVGVGLMIFLAAASDWEGGAWSIGIIPFLIGAGYLLVWKLEGKKDNAPPVT